MVKKGQATIKDIKKIVQKLVPVIKKKYGQLFHVRICEGRVCELHRRKEIEDVHSMTIVIGVEAVNFFWVEYKKTLEKTIRNILVHEFIHVTGLNHDYEGYKKGYYSVHYLDIYTPQIEKEIFGK